MMSCLKPCILVLVAGCLAYSAIGQESPEKPPVAIEETGNVDGEATETVDRSVLCPALLDENGEPVLSELGEPLFDESPQQVLDENGDPVVDEEGNALERACTLPEGLDETETPEEEQEATDPVAEETLLTPLFRLLDAGGAIIVILTGLAVIALAIGIVKFIQFLFLGVGRNGFVHRTVSLLRDGKDNEADDHLEKRRNPVARTMVAALRGRRNPKMNDELVREETTRVAQGQLDGLERGLSLLSLIATIAPLLGLLGTVLGMIEAFQQMETVGDRIEPAVLAGGIWEALLTTAAGLSVAIPAAVMFTWLQRSVDVEAQRMEDAATQVFTAPLYDAL